MLIRQLLIVPAALQLSLSWDLSWLYLRVLLWSAWRLCGSTAQLAGEHLGFA